MPFIDGPNGLGYRPCPGAGRLGAARRDLCGARTGTKRRSAALRFLGLWMVPRERADMPGKVDPTPQVVDSGGGGGGGVWGPIVGPPGGPKTQTK